jgi:GH25 family lysozyme M1 (1,4-beta-N-acetylmuramidase)
MFDDYFPCVLLWRMVTTWMAVLAFLLVTATAACAIALPLGSRAVRGLDVSSYQHAGRPINWRLLARDGIRFVAIKASEGTYYTNPYFASDARAAAAAGLSVVPYVFAKPRRAPGAATARFGAAAARYARGAGRLPLELDLENDPYAAADRSGNCYGLSVRQAIAWIAAFTAKTVALTGKPPIIYTTAAWWQECTGGTARFRRDPLWLAAYGTAAPGVPAPWKKWTFWQYDDDITLPGVGLVDVDFYQATPALPTLRQAAGHWRISRRATEVVSKQQFSHRAHHRR